MSIDLIAPGFSISSDQIQQAIQQVKSLGFQALWAGHLEKTFLFSASDQERARHLKKALVAAKDSQALWCIRGGYGSQRLIETLERMKKPQQIKILIGYSDATILQIFLNLKWKWPALHFPVLTHLKESSIGTPWAYSFKNKILFLEDIGESPHRIDRALWQMYHAQVFKGVKALVLGDFIGTKQTEKKQIKKECISYL